MKPTRSAAALVLVLAAAGGCGVPTHNTPQPIDAPPRPVTTSASAPPTQVPTGTVAEVVCLVRNERIAPVVRYVTEEPSVEVQLRHLLDGPTPAERDAGLTSALAGTDLVAGVRPGGSAATVEVRHQPDDAPRTDDIMAFGQIVCTLTARRDVTRVSFVQDGQPFGVPRADGSLSIGPLTTADYATLIAP